MQKQQAQSHPLMKAEKNCQLQPLDSFEKRYWEPMLTHFFQGPIY